MYSSLIKSVLFAFVVTNVENPKPPLSLEQLVMVNGVFKPELWPDLCVDLIPFEDEWIKVSRLLDRHVRAGAKRKLVSIPRIMACEYGVRFHWFLSVAIHTVGECENLSLHGHDRTGHDCWIKLGDGLQNGSYTMSVVSSTLEKIHSIIGDNIGVDAFYNILLNIISLITRHRLAESTAKLQHTETYLETLKIHTGSLEDVLIAGCKPRFTPLSIEDLTDKNEGQEHNIENRYDIYFRKMHVYIGYISDHLTNLDFHYDRNTGIVTYNNINANVTNKISLRTSAAESSKNTKVPLTSKRLDLTDGVYKAKHWRDIWFTWVKDEEFWEDVSRLTNPACRPGPWLKMRLIPKMIGCMYGVKFHWFLSLAIHVFGECNRLSRNNDVNAGDCWNKLVVVLQEGSYTMLQVMRSLLYTHSTVGDDVDLDVFYRSLSIISSFLNEHNVVESTKTVPECFNYVQSMQSHLVTLHTSLTSNCRPQYPLLNMNELMVEFQRRFPGAERYAYYANIMKYHMDNISDHLLQMGFHYDIGTGQTTYTLML